MQLNRTKIAGKFEKKWNKKHWEDKYKNNGFKNVAKRELQKLKFLAENFIPLLLTNHLKDKLKIRRPDDEHLIHLP